MDHFALVLDAAQGGLSAAPAEEEAPATTDEPESEEADA